MHDGSLCATADRHRLMNIQDHKFRGDKIRRDKSSGRKIEMGEGSSSPIAGVDRNGGDMIVHVSGEVNSHITAIFQEKMQTLLDEKPKRIVLNLADVTYMDSSGLASLVKVLSRTKQDKIALVLAAPSVMIRGVFEVTRLDSVFDLRDTVDEALA